MKTKQEDGREKIKKITEERTARIKGNNPIEPLKIMAEEVSPTNSSEVIVKYVDTNTREITIKFMVKTNIMKEEDIVDEIQGVLLKSAPEIADKLKNVITVEDKLLAATRQK